MKKSSRSYRPVVSQRQANNTLAQQVLLHKVRAFTDQPLGGNPAGVICFAQFPSDADLQQLAWLSAQPVTAMLRPTLGGYQIRWFTPQQEINLCGHGTLAAAALLFQQDPAATQFRFFSLHGDILVHQDAAGFQLCLPLFELSALAVAELPPAITQGVAVAAAAGRDLILELSTKQQVLDYQPDLLAIRRLPWHALIVTAANDEIDNPCYWLRYFAPGIGIDEDPATGSAHCSLLPYWQARHPTQNNITWQAQQCSAQGGEFQVRRVGQQLELTSQAKVLDAEVLVWIPG